jgi:hypothetical protein
MPHSITEIEKMFDESFTKISWTFLEWKNKDDTEVLVKDIKSFYRSQFSALLTELGNRVEGLDNVERLAEEFDGTCYKDEVHKIIQEYLPKEDK